MSYLEQIKQGSFGIDPKNGNASFRGVPFFIDEGEFKTGRRGPKFSFPGSDIPHLQDIGRKIRTFSVTGWVIGKDCLTKRNDLIKAAETAGSGILMHPFYGKLEVKCDDFSAKDSGKELFKTSITFEFTEVGSKLPVQKTIDTQVQVLNKVDEAYNTLNESFLKIYSVSRLPARKANEILKVVNLGVTAMSNSKRTLSNIAEFAFQVSSIINGINSIFKDAKSLADSMIYIASFGVVDDSVYDNVQPDVKQQFNDILPVTLFSNSNVSGSEEITAFSNLIKASAIISSVGLASKIPFDSKDEAIRYRDSLFLNLDDFLLTQTLGDNVYESIAELRAFLSEDINVRSATLSRLTTIVTGSTLPMLVISNMLYGSIEQEESLLIRNNVEHPLFSGGTTPLEVLVSV